MLDHLKSSAPVKLGFIPTRRTIFSREAAQDEKRRVEKKMREWKVEWVGLDWLNDEGLLFDGEDCPKVVGRFKAEGVDAVFAPHCNFGTEDAMAKVGRDVGKPFLLWGPRDECPGPNGERLRDSQCGLFATSKILRRLGVPFTYIVNSAVDSQVFERGFKNFLAAANVVRCFEKARIGQIDTRPQAFWSVMVNEGELLERWGVELAPIGLITLVAQTKAMADGEAVTREVRDLKARVDTSELEEAQLRKILAFKLAILDWAEERKLDAVALQCWSALQDTLGIFPCFIDAELTQMGLPVACETDIHGALTSLMLQAASAGQSPIFCADLTIRHPENENGELLWHCGPFPVALAEPDPKPKVTPHFAEAGCPAAGQYRIRGGDLTLARFDGDHGDYSLLMGHCRGVEGPWTFGTFVWAEVPNWPLWEEHLVYGPYIHHIIGLHGKYAPALYEACKYLGIQADPLEPTEAELRSFLRGQTEL